MQPPDPIRANGIVRSTTLTTDELHFTGGLRGVRQNGGWMVGPIVINDQPRAIGPVPDTHIQALCRDLGVEVFGADEISLADSELLTRVWHPFLQTSGLRPADKWAGISHAARHRGDDSYSKLARNLAISLRAADIRLRDASDEYQRQLRSALTRGAKPGSRFWNIALTDLHLAFHSLLAELASARDYFSAIAGRHIDAPEKKSDSLARLIDWTDAASRRHLRSDPLVSPLVAGWDETSEDRWLYDLGEYRNLFLHREPMGAGLGADGVLISERHCRYGIIRTMRMEIPIRPDASKRVEALERFLYLYRRLLDLLGEMADSALYPVEPPRILAG